MHNRVLSLQFNKLYSDISGKSGILFPLRTIADDLLRAGERLAAVEAVVCRHGGSCRRDGGGEGCRGLDGRGCDAGTTGMVADGYGWRGLSALLSWHHAPRVGVDEATQRRLLL